ncbi:hypothetical protein [Brevibacillus laterosporus]|uniref:hypothetical protein n=1 Tax=Brevibacillus laterosporus TaxID=1465 RepID=UPI003D21F45F
MSKGKAAEVKNFEMKKTRQGWIESAPYLKAERFEIAGALYDVANDVLFSESEVRNRLKKYRGGN